MPRQETITSRDNQHLVAARKVRDGKNTARIFIEGKRLAGEAIRSNLTIERVFVSDELASDQLVESVPDEKLWIIAERLFDSIADTKTPQGIVLIAERPVHQIETIERGLELSLPLVLFLKEINDPANLGAAVRAAEAAGVAGIILSPSSADPYSPKALRAAMGSAFRLPIVTEIGLDDAKNWASANKLRTTAADIGGDKNYVDIDWTQRRLLIMGSEAHGLRAEDLSQIDDVVTIPMSNDVESLNLAVSAGVVMFESRRQNGR